MSACQCTCSQAYKMESSGSPSPAPDAGDCGEKRGKGSGLLSGLSLEPMMLTHMIGLTLQVVTLQDFYLERICRITHGFSAETCANLTKNKSLETEIEATAADYTVYRQLIEAGIPVIFSLFVGPWSDKYGEKLPLLLAVSGYLFSAGLYGIVSVMPDVTPTVSLLCSVPIALTGGIITIVICVFSYVAKTSTEKNRSYKIAMIEGAWWAGSPIGLTAAAGIKKYYGLPSVFATATITYIVALVLGYFFMLEDCRLVADIPTKFSQLIAEMFNIDAVKDLFSTCFRAREGKRRRWIMILVSTLNLRLLSVCGIMNVLYLFTRNRLEWTFTDYSTFAAIDSVLGVTGMYIMIFVTLKWLKLKDPLIGVISCVSVLLAAVVLVATSASWMIYFASVVLMPSGLLATACRSLLSKCVSKKELGKIYSFLAAGEAVMPLIAAPLFGMMYKRTVSVYPGTVFLISVGISILMTLNFLYLQHSMKDFKTAEEMMEANGQAMTVRTSSASPETSDDEIEEDDNGIEISISRQSRFDKMEIISFA